MWVWKDKQIYAHTCMHTLFIKSGNQASMRPKKLASKFNKFHIEDTVICVRCSFCDAADSIQPRSNMYNRLWWLKIKQSIYKISCLLRNAIISILSFMFCPNSLYRRPPFIAKCSQRTYCIYLVKCHTSNSRRT